LCGKNWQQVGVEKRLPPKTLASSHGEVVAGLGSSGSGGRVRMCPLYSARPIIRGAHASGGRERLPDGTHHHGGRDRVPCAPPWGAHASREGLWDFFVVAIICLKYDV
jgi:hypothetical protein